MNEYTLDIDLYDKQETLIARVSFKDTYLNNEFILSGGRGALRNDTNLFFDNGAVRFLPAEEKLTGVIVSQNNLKFDVGYFDFTVASLFGRVLMTSNLVFIEHVSLKGTFKLEEIKTSN